MTRRRDLIEQAFADQRRYEDAMLTVRAWQQAGVRNLTIAEVIDLLTIGPTGADIQEPEPEDGPPAPAPAPDDEWRDPLFGTRSAAAEQPTDLDRVQAAVRTARGGGPAPMPPQGYG